MAFHLIHYFTLFHTKHSQAYRCTHFLLLVLKFLERVTEGEVNTPQSRERLCGWQAAFVTTKSLLGLYFSDLMKEISICLFHLCLSACVSFPQHQGSKGNDGATIKGKKCHY